MKRAGDLTPLDSCACMFEGAQIRQLLGPFSLVTAHFFFMLQYCEDFQDGDDDTIREGGYKSLTPAARLRILNVRIISVNIQKI